MINQSVIQTSLWITKRLIGNWLMNRRIDEVMRQTYRYYYEDGLVEIAVGLLFLVIGLLLLLWPAVQSGAIPGIVLAFGLPILTVLGAFLVRKAVQTVKMRAIHPRTGYISYRQQDWPRERRLFVTVALAVTLLSVFLPDAFRRMSFAEGLFLGLVLSLVGFRVGLRRFYWLALLAALLGTLVAALVPDDVVGSALTFSGAGIVMATSGAVAFAKYLLRHPSPGDNDA
jgi:hypothetical protein